MDTESQVSEHNLCQVTHSGSDSHGDTEQLPSTMVFLLIFLSSGSRLGCLFQDLGFQVSLPLSTNCLNSPVFIKDHRIGSASNNDCPVLSKVSLPCYLKCILYQNSNPNESCGVYSPFSQKGFYEDDITSSMTKILGLPYPKLLLLSFSLLAPTDHSWSRKPLEIQFLKAIIEIQPPILTCFPKWNLLLFLKRLD